MHPRETGRRYDAIAPFWNKTRQKSVQGLPFLERAIALCGSRGMALDVGCGSGGPMIEKLLGAGFTITGIDVSQAQLELAKTNHPKVQFIHGDIVEWETTLHFNLILAWDSIFHLPHGLHVPVIEKLCGALAERGVLLFTAGGIDGEITGNMHGHEFYYSSLADTVLVELVDRCGCIPVFMERDQYPLHHLVLIAAKRGDRAA